MKNPRVVITIPTFNSDPFIEKCLDAIKRQTYKNIEVNIVDGGSSDRTLEILRKKGIKEVIFCKDALLEARYQGVKVAKGGFVLLLDSDQILEKTTIQRLVDKATIENFLILALEEKVYNPRSFLEKLFESDRKLLHEVRDWSPYTGVILPRFYEHKLLLEAMENIPQHVRKKVGGQDHAIIYFEAWKINKKVDLLDNAVAHIEPSSYKVMWKKFFRWGKTSAGAHVSKYDILLKRKERFRTGLFKRGLIKVSLESILLLLLKGVPYKLGYYSAKFSK